MYYLVIAREGGLRQGEGGLFTLNVGVCYQFSNSRYLRFSRHFSDGLLRFMDLKDIHLCSVHGLYAI